MHGHDWSPSGRFRQEYEGQRKNETEITCLLPLRVRQLALVFMALTALGIPDLSALAHSQQPKKQHRSKKPSVRALETLVLRFTNDERYRQGLLPLQPSPALGYLARRHSSHMCRTGIFEHEAAGFPKGWQRFLERLKRVGLNSGGENIAFRTLEGDPELWAREVVHGWMNSTSHRKNILDPRFHYLGVGVHRCSDISYATQVFSPDYGSAQ